MSTYFLSKLLRAGTGASAAVRRSVLAGTTLLALSGAQAAVDTSAFPYSMGITFSGYTSWSTLTDFPALVVMSNGIPNFAYSQFKSAENAGDLRFTDENKTAWLDYEIETWSPFSGVPLSAPTNLWGCVLWLRADAGVQTNEAGCVTNWADQSGNGKDASQTDPARLPLYTAEAIRGNPAVTFDGAPEPDGDRLAFVDTPMQTIFIVNKVLSGTPEGGGIIGRADADLSVRRTNSLRWQFPGNENDFSSSAGSLFTVNGFNTAAVGENTWHALMAQRSGGTQSYNAIGGGYYQSRSFKGNIAEIIAFNRALTSEERGRINDYLYQKYGLGEKPGISCVWVRVPELKANTKIFAYWGSADATPPACTTNGATWNSNFAGVWHALSQTNASVLPDSTAGLFNGANNSATAVAGVIGNAMNFNVDLGANVNLPGAFLSSVSSAITISLWQYGSAREPLGACVFEGKRGNERVLGSHLPWADSMEVYWDAGYAAGQAQPFDRIEKRVAADSDYKGQWNHWVYVKDANTGFMDIYLNGESWYGGAWGLTRPITGIDSFRLGSGVDWGYYDGVIDEFRVSNVAQSPDWIRASFLNQAPNSAFSTYDSVEIAKLDTKPYRCSMRIDFAGYTGADTLKNFPALVVFTNGLTDFAFSQFKAANGGDLRFTDADKTTWLNYEIEQWPDQESGGTAYVWVQLPALQGTNTSIWAFWGNPNATRPTYATNGAAWAQNFAGVWHALNPADTSALSDSTAGHHPGAASGVGDVPGLIGNALSFNGTSVFIPVAALASATNEITISLWQYGTSSSADCSCSVFEGMANGVRVLNAHLPWSSKTVFWDSGILAGVDPPFDRYNKDCMSDSDWRGQWNQWVFTKNTATGFQSIYLNGAFWGGRDNAWRTMVGIDSFSLGSGVGWAYYTGLIDEFRIQNVAQTPDWIRASYLNQASNSVFNTYGAVSKQFFGALVIFR